MKFGKNSNIIKKEFNSEPAHDKKHLKAKKKKPTQKMYLNVFVHK